MAISYRDPRTGQTRTASSWDDVERAVSGSRDTSRSPGGEVQAGTGAVSTAAEGRTRSEQASRRDDSPARTSSDGGSDRGNQRTGIKTSGTPQIGDTITVTKNGRPQTIVVTQIDPRTGNVAGVNAQGGLTQVNPVDLQRSGYTPAAGSQPAPGIDTPRTGQTLLANMEAPAQQIILALRNNSISMADAVKALTPLTTAGTKEAAEQYINNFSIFGQTDVAGGDSFLAGGDSAPVGQGVRDFLNLTGLPSDAGANIDFSQFRRFPEAAFSAVSEQFPVDQTTSGIRNFLLDRAQGAEPLFNLGVSLGQFGQPSIGDGQFQFGGNPLQDLQQQFGLSAVSGLPSTGQFQNVINEAIQGLQSPGRSEAVEQALGFNFTDPSRSAMDVFGQGIGQFLRPRLGLLPTPIRSLVGTGVNQQIEQMLGGRAAGEIDQLAFLRDLQNRGVLF